MNGNFICSLIINIVVLILLIVLIIISVYYTFVINDCNKKNISLQECLGIEDIVQTSIDELLNSTISSLDKTLETDSRKLITILSEIPKDLKKLNEESKLVRLELIQLNKELKKVNEELPEIKLRLNNIDEELKNINSEIKRLRNFP